MKIETVKVAPALTKAVELKYGTNAELGRILKNQAYIGNIVYDGKTYPGKHPAIISLVERVDLHPDTHATVHYCLKGLGSSGELRWQATLDHCEPTWMTRRPGRPDRG